MVCTYMLVCVCVCPQKPEEGIVQVAGITGSYELPAEGVGPGARAASTFYLLSHLSSPRKMDLKLLCYYLCGCEY